MSVYGRDSIASAINRDVRHAMTWDVGLDQRRGRDGVSRVGGSSVRSARARARAPVVLINDRAICRIDLLRSSRPAMLSFRRAALQACRTQQKIPISFRDAQSSRQGMARP